MVTFFCTIKKRGKKTFRPPKIGEAGIYTWIVSDPHMIFFVLKFPEKVRSTELKCEKSGHGIFFIE